VRYSTHIPLHSRNLEDSESESVAAPYKIAPATHRTAGNCRPFCTSRVSPTQASPLAPHSLTPLAIAALPCRLQLTRPFCLAKYAGQPKRHHIPLSSNTAPSPRPHSTLNVSRCENVLSRPAVRYPVRPNHRNTELPTFERPCPGPSLGHVSTLPGKQGGKVEFRLYTWMA